MDWSEPTSVKSWVSRLFSIRPILVVLVVYCLLLSEFRFDWAEQILGTYLTTTNEYRPQSGAIWEKSRQTLTARETLEQIVTDRQSTQREARDADTLAQIAAVLTETYGVMLSADHFRTLYLKLPAGIAQDIISPFELLKIFNTGQWERTYIRRFGEDLRIYLLDRQNRVLREMGISREILKRIERTETEIAASLDDLPNLRHRIYTAARFFRVLESLPEDVRRGIVADPESLLDFPGRILRVGISDETVSGLVDIGLEFEVDDTLKVFLVQARDWAVWRLRAELEDGSLDRRPDPETAERGRR